MKTQNSKLNPSTMLRMTLSEAEWVKTQNHNLKFKTFSTCIVFLLIVFCFFGGSVLAITPVASPSATVAPEENVQELREIIKEQAIKENIDEIKEKIENKAYVGTILEITDSTLTISNFRGKQRVRLDETTTILGSNKKEIKSSDLALEDKIIAMGSPDENKTLDTKRLLVVIPPKTVSPKKMTALGTISEINLKTSTITLSEINKNSQRLQFKIDKNTLLIDQADSKNSLALKDFEQNQKLIVVYLQTDEGKTPTAKTVFLLQ